MAEDELFQGYPQSAEPLLRQALAIRREKYTAGHPAIVSALVRLGEALVAEGEESAAEPVLRDALVSARSAPFDLPKPRAVRDCSSIRGPSFADRPAHAWRRSISNRIGRIGDSEAAIA